jgi:hypothetical protein
MRFQLHTLLIALAITPPVLALFWSDFSIGLGTLVYIAALALLLPAARYLARRGIYRRAAHGGLPARRRLDNRE